MDQRKFYRPLIFAALLSSSWGLTVQAATLSQTLEAANTRLVQQAFDDWRDGRGKFFDLLTDDAVWTVSGSSPVSGVYHTREALLQGAVNPIHARLATAITPTVTQIVAQGDQVVVFWDGSAQSTDGNRYVNSYAWQLVFTEGKITRVTAYLDTWALDKLME